MVAVPLGSITNTYAHYVCSDEDGSWYEASNWERQWNQLWGCPCYFNIETGEMVWTLSETGAEIRCGASSWVLPADAACPDLMIGDARPSAAEQQRLEEQPWDWEQHWSEQCNCALYYDTKTKDLRFSPNDPGPPSLEEVTRQLLERASGSGAEHDVDAAAVAAEPRPSEESRAPAEAAASTGAAASAGAGAAMGGAAASDAAAVADATAGDAEAEVRGWQGRDSKPEEAVAAAAAAPAATASAGATAAAEAAAGEVPGLGLLARGEAASEAAAREAATAAAEAAAEAAEAEARAATRARDAECAQSQQGRAREPEAPEDIAPSGQDEGVRQPPPAIEAAGAASGRVPVPAARRERSAGDGGLEPRAEARAPCGGMQRFNAELERRRRDCERLRTVVLDLAEKDKKMEARAKKVNRIMEELRQHADARMEKVTRDMEELRLQHSAELAELRAEVRRFRHRNAELRQGRQGGSASSKVISSIPRPLVSSSHRAPKRSDSLPRAGTVPSLVTSFSSVATAATKVLGAPTEMPSQPVGGHPSMRRSTGGVGVGRSHGW